MVDLIMPNFVNTLAQADQAAAFTKDQRRQNALATFMSQNGDALMQGDTNALAQFARLDPMAAMQIQQRQQDQQWRADDRAYSRQQDALANQRADRQESRLNATAAQQAEEWRVKLDDRMRGLKAEDLAAQTAQFEGVLSGAAWFFQSGDKPGYNQFLLSKGIDPAQYPFEQFPAHAAQFKPVLDAMKAFKPEVPTPQSAQAKFEADKRAGLLPPDAVYQAGGNTTVNMGGNSSEFVKESDKLAAKRMGDVVGEGQGAARLMGDLQAIAGLAGQIDTGKGAELLNRFGPYAEMLGVRIDGLPEMQAYQAIVDRLAPQMRTPGAGSSSDYDARQFLSSLPNLSRLPEGNAIINETLQSVQRQKMAAAEIAGQAQSGEITWQEADRKIAALGNPFETFNKMRDKISGGASQAPQIGEVRKGYRFKGGDPADPNSWERQ